MENRFFIFDEKESGCGFYYKAKNQKEAELAFFADFGVSPKSCKEVKSAIALNKELFRSSKLAIETCDCF